MDCDLSHFAGESTVCRQNLATDGQSIVLHTHWPVASRDIVPGEGQLGGVSLCRASKDPGGASVVEDSATAEADACSNENRDVVGCSSPAWTAAVDGASRMRCITNQHCIQYITLHSHCMRPHFCMHRDKLQILLVLLPLQLGNSFSYIAN